MVRYVWVGATLYISGKYTGIIMVMYIITKINAFVTDHAKTLYLFKEEF